MYRIGVDVGGTFTDCVVYQGETVPLLTTKVSSVPDDPAKGVMAALEHAASELGFELSAFLADTDAFVHGSTIATNTMIQRNGARTAVLTSLGHEDTLPIGKIYQKRAGLTEREMVRMSHLDLADPPLVTRDLILGIAERVDYKGDVIAPLNGHSIDAAIDWLKRQDVEAVAICLLWSFLNPEHEERLHQAIEEQLPKLYVSSSHRVAPVLGEYERSVTTLLNAYLGPPIAAYLSNLQTSLKNLGFRHPLLLMTAGGGIVLPEAAAEQAVTLLDSGPVGGTLGSRHFGNEYGESNVICTDVGGTSFDVSLIYEDSLQLEKEPVIDKYVFKIPKVAVKSIGAGGGSIAWVDENGVLKVGPHSAGAQPGPACYGRGGTEATVTDADLVLGYLNPEALLGGGLALEKAAAEHAVGKLAKQLGVSTVEAAAGIYKILNSHMADLLRKVTIERGFDPREFVLFAYGGAGAAHAAMYAADAGVKKVYILGDATAFSALGMLTTDITHSFERSRPTRSPFSKDDLAAINTIFEELEADALSAFASEGVGENDVVLNRSVLMRFQMQVHELEIEVPRAELDATAMESLTERFASTYQDVYGEDSAFPDAGVELVTFRMIATTPTALKSLPRSPASHGADSKAARKGRREAYFEEGGLQETNIYDGGALKHGHVVDGPAILERFGDTVVIPPNFSASVDEFGNLLIESTSAPSEDKVEGELDPITYEVIRNRLWAINDEQAMTAAMTSGTPIIYEAFDFNSGILDADGYGVFAGVYVVYHTTGLDIAVQGVIDRFGKERIGPGDMFITNDPWVGAIHPSDVVVVSPVFHEDELLCWSAIVMHDPDVGGPVPGSWVVGATNIFEECPIYPPLKLADGGDYRQEVEDLYLRNSRTPALNALNFRARVASQSVARRRIIEVVERYGVAAFKQAVRRIQEEVETTVRRRLKALPDGEWFEHGYIDHDGNDNILYEAQLRLIKKGETLTFDFTGTCEQAPGLINGTISALRGGIMAPLLPMLCHDVPWATGGLRDVVNVIAEPGTLNNASYPAACTGGSVFGEGVTENLVTSCLAKMLACSEVGKADMMACWYPYYNGFVVAGVNQHGGPLAAVLLDASAGGAGARAFKDGIDCGGYIESVSVVLPNVESNERVYPILELYRRRLPDTNGHGKFRGGVGIEMMVISHDAPVPVTDVVFASAASQPEGPGIYGGLPPSVQGNLIGVGSNVHEMLSNGEIPLGQDDLRFDEVVHLASKDVRQRQDDDVHILWTSGGAGYGDPVQRNPASVMEDVTKRLCSVETALNIYGVVVADDGTHDAAATEARRESIRRERLDGATPIEDAISDLGSKGVTA